MPSIESYDDLVRTVQWLADRAEISDLLHSFARALDTKDWASYAANFAPDGELILPWPNAEGTGLAGHKGSVGLADYVSNGLGGFFQTHHMSTNHQIKLDEDTAQSTSYCQCVHRRNNSDVTDVWELGGWYRNNYRRTTDGWRFTTVRLEAVWQNSVSPT